MANIQTPIRLINVKETYEEVLKAMDLQWMEVTEDTSFYRLPFINRIINLKTKILCVTEI